MEPKFQIFHSTDKQYYFRLKARNGEIILGSEGYTTKQSCLNGVDSVKRHAPYDHYYDRRESINGQYYFNLEASNGQVIGTSETYTTKQSRENGIEAVKREAPVAIIEDLTPSYV